MKRFLSIFFFVFFILFNSTLVMANQSTNQYQVEVEMWKKNENTPSMGRNALEPKAKLIKKGKNYFLRLTFVPLKTMGQSGYLGGIQIPGKEVKIISEYDVVDEINHPETGTNEKMRGKLYPKEVEFEFDPKLEFTNAKLYIPAMDELGFGQQEVRIKLGEKDYVKFNQMDQEKLKEVGAAIDRRMADGYYRVPVQLLHISEDRASMGNAALNQIGEVRVEGGEAFLYIETDKIQVQGIVASLTDIFYQVDKKYILAEKGDFSLDIPEEPTKRPKIFRIPVEIDKKIVNMLVDPKVSIMGDDPLKARLKIEWQEVEEKKIKTGEEKKQSLEYRFNNGDKREVFQKTQGGERRDKSFILRYEGSTFEEDFSFYVNKIVGKEEADYKTFFPPLSIIEMYRVDFLKPLKELQGSTSTLQEQRERIKAKKEVELLFPIKEIKESDHPKIYKLESGKAKEIKWSAENGYFKINGKAGDFAIVKSTKTKGTSKGWGKPISAVKKKKPVKGLGKKVNKPISGVSTGFPMNKKDDGVDHFLQSEGASSDHRGKLEEKELEILSPQENKKIIVCVIFVIAMVNGASIFILKKTIRPIFELMEENKRLKGGEKV